MDRPRETDNAMSGGLITFVVGLAFAILLVLAIGIISVITDPETRTYVPMASTVPPAPATDPAAVKPLDVPTRSQQPTPNVPAR